MLMRTRSEKPAQSAFWTAKARRTYLCLDDFERVARRRLPLMLEAFIAEGSETNASLRGNRAGFEHYALLPRVLRDVSVRRQDVTLFGERYCHPFGIAPMGLSGACAYRADLALAQAAGSAGIPMIISASSVIPLEEINKAAPSAWFQAYLPGEPERIEPMLDRVAAAGFQTLVLTVDVPVLSNREHFIRSGFSIPLRPSMKLFWQGVTHPRWLFGTALRTVINHGMPHFENMDAMRGPPFLSREAIHSFGRRDSLDWRSVARIRRGWRGKFVLKGILSPADASMARDTGIDGIIVSNHGGRQLDCAVSPIRVLPGIRERSGDMTVMLDSGIRRGTDVLKALALGAQFVFLGRPFLYAAVVGGERAVRYAAGLLGEEIDIDMALLGISDISETTSEHVIEASRLHWN
jgi:L-lactate dehydrogenase (cytochrome)